MERWFLTGAYSLRRGAQGWAQMLLSTYSHSGFIHLAMNMLGLYSFAPRLMDGMSTRNKPKLSVPEFMTMYTAAGLVGSYSSNLFSARLRHNVPGLGASGAIFGLITYYALCYPENRVLLFFVLDMTTETAIAAMTAVNIGLCSYSWYSVRRGGHPASIDGMAHLGGTVVGAAFYAYKRARWDSERGGGASPVTKRGTVV